MKIGGVLYKDILPLNTITLYNYSIHQKGIGSLEQQSMLPGRLQHQVTPERYGD